MKLGVFSLSLFNPESSHPTEAHTHFPYNIKCTLSAPPPPHSRQILQQCCFTDVFLLVISVVPREIEDNPFAIFFGGESNKVYYENMQFFKVIPSLNENFIITSFNVINTVAQLQQIINFLTFSED